MLKTTILEQNFQRKKVGPISIESKDFVSEQPFTQHIALRNVQCIVSFGSHVGSCCSGS